jgi:hypothetical protein
MTNSPIFYTDKQIKSLIKKVDTKARLDELKNIAKYTDLNTRAKYISDRIVLLRKSEKAQVN